MTYVFDFHKILYPVIKPKFVIPLPCARNDRKLNA